ncbi:MAG: hypothetical protein OXQ31_18065 [Spirochaetaceae bacterium]|nr:hypothetical protein [Spirochaetaceae bacterium]
MARNPVASVDGRVRLPLRPVLTVPAHLRAAAGGALAGLLIAGLAVAVPLREHMRVLGGSVRFSRGEHTQAIVRYRQVDAPHAAYNLAAAYAALGEAEAAERVLARLADQVADAELRFRISFNRGNLAFERGDYRAAALAFRSALAVRGDDRSAKRNLELALRRLAAAPPSASGPADGDGGDSGAAEQLLRFAVQQEDTVWGSRSADEHPADSW